MIINMPAKKDGAPFECIVHENGEIGLYSNNWKVVSFHLPVDPTSTKGLKYHGDAIAGLLEEARDIGFQQGLASVRESLGIKGR